MAGLSDGRVLAFSDSEYKHISGQSHASLVVGMATATDGKVYSVGYDDQVREISAESASFVYVRVLAIHFDKALIVSWHSQASCPTASQPKSLAVSNDSTVFVVEIDVVEAIRSNQKVHELKPKFSPSAVAASGTAVAIGGEVCVLTDANEVNRAETRIGPEGLPVQMGRQVA